MRPSRDPQQGLLFGTPEPPGPRGVGPAEPDQELVRIAERLPATMRFGTSSWSFPGWQDIVYDRVASKSSLARNGLAAYARHPLLRSVGIDRSFYAPLESSDLAAYAEAVPPSFRFLVKAFNECTAPYLRDSAGRPGEPNPHFLDPSFAADQVVAPYVEGLGDRAGCLLFQFSPLGGQFTERPKRFAEFLHNFLRALPAGPTYAVELRDRELLAPAYLDALEAAGARHCFNVHPRMPALKEQWQLAGQRDSGLVVVRWMLGAGLRYETAIERYEPFSSLVDEDDETRETLTSICAEEIAGTRPILIVANNKAEGSAPLSVFKLARHVVERLGV